MTKAKFETASQQIYRERLARRKKRAERRAKNAPKVIRPLPDFVIPPNRKTWLQRAKEFVKKTLRID